VPHRGRKRRLDMRTGRRKSRAAIGTDPTCGAAAAMQISVSATGRHAESGTGRCAHAPRMIQE